MSVHNFTNDLFVTVINGRTMSDYGESATPFTDSPIDPKRALRRGQGGGAVILGRTNPGRAVSIAFNPGSPDSAFMQGLFKSGAVITLSRTQIGTLDAAIGTEGTIINDGPVGRGGTTITDDVFMMEFNTWDATKGGE